MTTPVRKSDILQKNANLTLVIVGFLLIGIGNSFEVEIFKIELGRLIAEVGGLVLVVGLLHWLYESTMRRQLFREIVESVVGAGEVSASGICDFKIPSREIDYRELIEKSERLWIGEHYSTKIFEDYVDSFAERHGSGKPTLLLQLLPGSAGDIYLKEAIPSSGVDERKIARIRQICGKGLTIRWHKLVLRYSFVMTDTSIWVRFYRNSEGYSVVPAIRVSEGSNLYEFFSKDIDELLNGCVDD